MFVMSQIAIIFCEKSSKVEQPLIKCNFEKCQNLTFNRWQRIERKHDID